MRVLVKDINNKVIFESFGKNSVGYCEVIADDYDYSKIEISTGSIVMNNIKVMKTYRLVDAPEVHEGENIKN